MRLPVAVRGALMPDAHVGYGLPIGGVLATENAVIPYAVGVDIACRMKLTVFDLPALNDARRRRRARPPAPRPRARDPLRRGRHVHANAGASTVLDADWRVTPSREAARPRLGAARHSGSGNHFVEFGVLTLARAGASGLAPGEYLALLTHSGSRGTGAQSRSTTRELGERAPPGAAEELAHLAWLDLDIARPARSTGPR